MNRLLRQSIRPHLVSLAFCLPLGAAPIDWTATPYVHTGSAKNTMGVDQFAQTGTLTLAVNLGAAGAQTLVQATDADIAFAADDPALGITNMTGSAAAGTFHANLGGNNQISSSGAFTPTSGDQGSPATVTLGGLTADRAYRIQCLLMDGRGGFSGRTARFDGSDLGSFANGVSGVTWGDGLLATGIFTADAASQDFTIQIFGGATSLGGHLNAILVHDVTDAGPPAAVPERMRVGQWIRPARPASVIEQAGWHVWGGSVVEENGQYHMFYARWPVDGYAWGDGWLFASEIWHAVADNPAGPFTPTQLVLGGREGVPGDAFWDSRAPHNPHVRKFGGKVYLYYTGTRDPGEAAWPGVSLRNRLQRTQRIGAIEVDSVQDLLAGNFTRPPSPLLEPVTGNSAADDITSNPDPAAIPANRILNNPSVIERPDGKFQLIYKTNWPQAPGFAFGQALADAPTGPFSYVPGALLDDGGQYEDQFHWYDPVFNRFNLVVKRFGTGIDQFVSEDSSTWTLLGRQSDIAVFRDDGSFEALDLMERPQLFLGVDGQPRALYTAVRESLPGGGFLSYNLQVPLEAPTATAIVFGEESDVLNSGLPVLAVNLGSNAPLTLNGLEFTPAGTDAATLATAYGFVQAGGDPAATLNTAANDSLYEGVPAFEGFLDTIAWQTGSVLADATLSFDLAGLTPGREYRLQLFLGESRASNPRHGPQLLEVGGAPAIRFDYGLSGSLVSQGATAVRLAINFTAAAASVPVTLRNATSGGSGLQLAAFALHDVSMPSRVEIAHPGSGNPVLTFRDLVPGFQYRVRRSSDLGSWEDAPAPNTLMPTGADLVDETYTDPAPPSTRAFYRLLRED